MKIPSTANDDFDGDIFLHDAMSKIKGTAPPLEQSAEELAAQKDVLILEKKLKDLRLLQLETDITRKTLLGKLKVAKGKVSETDPSDASSNTAAYAVKVDAAKSEPSMFAREFKISSQIGQPGQKDKSIIIKAYL